MLLISTSFMCAFYLYLFLFLYNRVQLSPVTTLISQNNKWKIEGLTGYVINAMLTGLNISHSVVKGSGDWGSPLKNGSWSGMVGALVRGDIDVMVGPSRVTPSRS